MADNQTENLGPLTELARRLFHMLNWLSPTQWLKPWIPDFRPRNELTPTEFNDHELISRRMRAIDCYVIVWITLELILGGFSCFGPWPFLVSLVVMLVVTLRIVEIVQVIVNVALFDILSGRPDQIVASVIRVLVLAGINFIELSLCFGIVYATNFYRLAGTGATGPESGFYISIMTQLTNGYSDIYPTGWLRFVAAAQGLISLLFVILVFGLFVSSLRPLKGILDPRDIERNRHS